MGEIHLNQVVNEACNSDKSCKITVTPPKIVDQKEHVGIHLKP